ncbi:SMI1/KNR4 family protein [Desulfovibrio sp. OttesenSCG-928-F07]|nr:SMI1/KNR4 family protein [Desulfovibrio sp. OttesenSCG-928-F07]
MKIVNKYLHLLKQSLGTAAPAELTSLNTAQGATAADLAALKTAYPECPKALLALLEQIDGTYHREYAGNKISVYLLGSDIAEYPYYLLSTAQMLTHAKSTGTISDIYAGFVEDIDLEASIDVDLPLGKWLHFADCMNNGGTSQLFIDFDPLEGGVKGQIVRFLHDPDGYDVIADSFEEYLQHLIDDEFDFLQAYTG